ncbi:MULTISPECIES: filamentous hemagglutinin N-terminal domain-containing protein [unclassified Nostoc]|uniref:two-partner secretion domain-containing protein n=1 Tax=unclassified Nostoc TaxID=2593658 RepID=UPI002AD55D55|nr:filamentous hemagglutinin N-terminal domain-containing protein [Nostoc sp. DedQUE03]MDZ7976124.1 filamentous hemagglutinin N-terminal domain-containing protein [Nostoc sp. DedQUE03]MDZ8044100.1 filamentous hemagglutinin N-terminal domain-containing protein [Nostoc sp. DedQUE02]
MKLLNDFQVYWKDTLVCCLNVVALSGCMSALAELTVGIALFEKPVFAQSKIIPDNSLGAESSGVVPFDSFGLPVDVINRGAIRQTNLFHSFQEFNVGEGRDVYFVNPSNNIQNIIARVTGQNRSDIFGTLGIFNATGVTSNPNLFLMNPNGIVFGKNASLDVPASFVGTTANGIQFGNQGVFSATNPEAPPLLTVNPSALLFNQINKNAAIQNNSVARAGTDPAGLKTFGLRVPDGKSLLLVGGNVNINDGELNAYGGRIELGGLAESGNVNLFIDGDNLKLTFPENVTRADVSLTNQAFVLVQGADGGNIAVNAQNINVLGNSQIIAGIAEGIGTPESQAGDITLNATGVIQLKDGGVIGNRLFENATGEAGDINITTNSLELSSGGQISTSTFGQGNAGNILIQAGDRVAIDGRNVDSEGFRSGIFSSVQQNAQGNAGDIVISTKVLDVSNAGTLQTVTFGIGDAGNIKLEAGDRISFKGSVSSEAGGFLPGTNNPADIPFGSRAISDVAPGGRGKGGNITISTNILEMSDSAQLQARTLGTGDAGNIAIQANERASINNSNILTGTFGIQGKAGDIRISTNTLEVSNRAFISSSTARIIDADTGIGDAGNVNIEALNRVFLNNSSISTTVGVNEEISGQGKGGDIRISTNALEMSNNAELNSSTYGLGNAGDVVVEAEKSVELDSSNIFAGVGETSISNGGNIRVKTGFLSLKNEAYISAATAGYGRSGNIDVNTERLVAQDGAAIFSGTFDGSSGAGGNLNIIASDSVEVTGTTADSNFATSIGTKSFGSGNAGNVSIDTKQLLVTNGGTVQTETSGLGKAGTLQINASDSVEVVGTAPNESFVSGISSENEGSGGAGEINITTGRLITQNRGQIAAGTRSGDTGNGADINIQARDRISLDYGGGIFSDILTGAGGNGGNINIDTRLLSVSNGALISTASIGRGKPGNIKIHASDSVSFDGKLELPSGIQSFAGIDSTGKGGDINITTGTMFITNGAELNALTASKEPAGNIFLNIGGNLQISNGEITTQSLESSGGSINITAKNIRLNSSSNIRSNVSDGSGGGGNITLLADSIFSSDDSDIFTFATSGKGGNITLTANSIIALNDSDILAFSLDGQGGNITLNTPAFFGQNYRPAPNSIDISTERNDRVDINASGAVSGVISLPDTTFIQNSLTDLPQNAIDTNALIVNSCISRGSKRQENSFTITGSGALRNSPGDVLISAYTTGDVRSVEPTPRPWKKGDPIIEPQGLYRLPNGQLILSRSC